MRPEVLSLRHLRAVHAARGGHPHLGLERLDLDDGVGAGDIRVRTRLDVDVGGGGFGRAAEDNAGRFGAVRRDGQDGKGRAKAVLAAQPEVNG